MRKLALFGVAVSAASCANAELPMVSPDAVVSAASDCAVASFGKIVDTDELERLGWREASVQAEGREIEAPMSFYGKEDGGPILMVSGAGQMERQGCLITGRLEELSDFEILKGAFSAAFENAGQKDNDRYFRIGTDIAVLSPTGSRSNPSFRVAVLELGETK